MLNQRLTATLLSAILLLTTVSTNLAAKPTTAALSFRQTSPAELKSRIIKESQPGGKLDFFTAIKGHEHDGRQISPGVYASGLEYALYSWGSAVKDMGVQTAEEAYEIYSDFTGKPATVRDKATIRMGFTKSLDK